MTVPESEPLSRLLFDAREAVEMLADIVEVRTGKPDVRTRSLVARIDAYRAQQGWPGEGFTPTDRTQEGAPERA